jgi:hypothetical protein
VVVVRLVLGTSSVLDVVAFALLTLHDAMDGARMSVFVVIVQTMSQLPLLALAMELINVAASVTSTPIVVKVGTEVAISRAIRPRLVRVVLVDLLLDGREFAMRRSIRSTARVPA